MVKKINGTEIIEHHSGYTHGIQQWINFLNCWEGNYQIFRDRNLIKNGYDIFSILNMKNVSIDIKEKSNDARAQLMQAEKRLGVKLPQSYKDFVVAFGLVRMISQEAATEQNMIGMFLPSRIRRLAEADSLTSSLILETPLNSPDDEYFVYGIKEDCGSGRAHFWSDAILVGMYGDAMFERVVLYPQVRTEDGEMEASMGFHASEFRAPSFAELMRQLSYMETHDIVNVPPYAQLKLENTCADKLPLKNVWWE